MAEPTNTCPRCGTTFTCGMRAGASGCWCAALPAAFAVPADAAGECYCPGCLAELMAASPREPVSPPDRPA